MLPTPVFRPGEFHGLDSPWGLKVLDTTERLPLFVNKIDFFLTKVKANPFKEHFPLRMKEIVPSWVMIFYHSFILYAFY